MGCRIEIDMILLANDSQLVRKPVSAAAAKICGLKRGSVALRTASAPVARVRAGLPQLHASAATAVLPDTDDGVLAVVRRHASGSFVGLYNVSAQRRPFHLHRLRAAGLWAPSDGRGEDTADPDQAVADAGEDRGRAVARLDGDGAFVVIDRGAGRPGRRSAALPGHR